MKLYCNTQKNDSTHFNGDFQKRKVVPGEFFNNHNNHNNHTYRLSLISTGNSFLYGKNMITINNHNNHTYEHHLNRMDNRYLKK
jgi:hypothetical protein